MSFASICPNCRAKLKLKNPELIGKRAKCPKCAEPFVVKKMKVKTAPEPAAASVPAPTSTPAPRPAAPEAPDEDWLNDDLGSFDTDDNWPPSGGDSAAPPVVTGAKKKRRKTSAAGKAKKRPNGYEGPNVIVSCLLAAMAGGIAAAIGVGIWFAIAIMTGYEIGIVAILIGGLIGFGTYLGSRDHIVGDLSGIIAGVMTLLALTGPKLLILLLGLLLNDAIGIGDLFHPLDALWIPFAVVTAFRVGSGQAGDD